MARKKKTKKVKKTKEVEPTWWLKVEYYSQKYITRHAERGERWDGDDLAHSQEIRGYSIHDKNTYGEVFPLMSEPDINKTYWVVYVNYSTGDSFHHETGCICFVDIFEDANDAEYLTRLLEKDYENKDDYSRTPLKVKFPSGIEKEIYTGTWKGYFERLESVRCEAIRYIKQYENT